MYLCERWEGGDRGKGVREEGEGGGEGGETERERERQRERERERGELCLMCKHLR